MDVRLNGIPRGEVLRYLGFRGPVPEDLSGVMDRLEAVLRETVRPRIVWRRFGIEPDGRLSGTVFRPEGGSVRELLRGCSGAVLFAATLGSETDLLLKREQRRNMADAAVLDAMASAAVESVCDRFCSDLARETAPEMLTPRFSPGYGDFPLSQQKDFFAVLDITRRTGITLTPGFLMVPQKSVTALMGVSDRPPVSPGSGCGACRLADRCLYRKEGLSCGK